MHPIDIILLGLVLLPALAGILAGPLPVLVQLVNWTAASAIMLSARGWLHFPEALTGVAGRWSCGLELLVLLLGTLIVLILLQKFLLTPLLLAHRVPAAGRRLLGGALGALLGVVVAGALVLPVQALPLAWQNMDSLSWPFCVRFGELVSTLLPEGNCLAAGGLAKVG